ncbi:MAG: SdrD B-like domain-containing protein [Acidobacteriota bacterium]
MKFTVSNDFSEAQRDFNNRFRNFSRWAVLFMSLAFAIALAFMFERSVGISRAAAGTITGFVFQDYNANGVRDANNSINNSGSGNIGAAVDRGVAGVTVTGYTSFGAVAGTATTDGQGNFSLNVSGDAPYRIEFTNLPAGYKPGPFGPDSKTTVQFVSASNATNISLGLVVPGDYCQDNPLLATGCYVSGEQSTDSPVVISFPYAAGSARETGGAPFTDFDQPLPGSEAQSKQVGTTWGIAYARSARQLYVAAFMKKHTGFGPAGAGAIYKIDRTGNTVGAFADLNAIFGAGTAGSDPHDPNNFDTDNGNAAWDAVGKISLGGMAISDDEKKLYVMNLADRQLYELPLDAAPTSANIRRRAVPLNPPGCSNALDVRPFAVNFNSGQIYVGMVCSAESTITQAAPDGDPTKLLAYVYSVNPTTLNFSASPVFQMPLNYPRRCADSGQLGPGNCFSAAWRAWSPVYRNIGTAVDVGPADLSRGIYPQPMLTDLAFDRGNLILGLRDRAGDQFGNATLDNPAENVLRYYGVSAGDALRACGDVASGWVLENNGRCGGAGAAPQNTGEGPGGGEFYFRDESLPYTDEIFMGGMAQLPGFPDVVINGFDPIPIFDLDNLFDGGARWLSNNSGALSKTYRVYNGNLGLLGPFGKANGLSDLAALCDPAPIEIGNRVWQDTNGNGIQDADELGISGVRVRLFKNGAQVGEAMTNGRGEFYFNASNVSGGALPAMDYEIRVEKNQQPLDGFILTNSNADNSANGDSRDSDAVMGGANAVITLTTGGPGESNHTFDMGFQPPGGGLMITCPPDINVTAVVNATSAVVSYTTPPATGQGVNVICVPPSGSTFQLGMTTVTCRASNAFGVVSCSFKITVSPAIVCPGNITTPATGAGGAPVTYPTPTAGAGATVTCAPPSGSTFPIGTTNVTCTLTSPAGNSSCGFTVTVTPMMQKSAKCDTICFRSPNYYLLNLNRLPGGTVLIGGVNNNQPVSTKNTEAIMLALRGRPISTLPLTAPQHLNQEFVAAQLSLNAAGGSGSPVTYNVLWSMLSCYQINFAGVTLSNGVTLAPGSVLADLFTQAQLAIQENRTADMSAIAAIFDMLNGNDPQGRCGR